MVCHSFCQQGTRLRQEDAILVLNDLMVVCDGVGGQHDGEIISQRTIAILKESFHSTIKENINEQSLNAFIKKIQLELNKLINIEPKLVGSGTTLALIYIHNDYAYTAHIGDSRILLFKNNSNKIWSTKDHSVVQDLYDAGILKSEEEMKSHPLKNRITNALTIGKDPTSLLVTIHELKGLELNDLIILCTDGVLEQYTNNDLYHVFNTMELSQAFNKIKTTCEKGAKDNNSMIVIKI